MKVASSELLSQKCNSADINDFDVTYLNKLNETINANVGGLVSSSTTNTKQLKKSQSNANTSFRNAALQKKNPGSGSDVRDNGEIVVRVDELSSMCNNLANKSIVYDGKGEDKLSLQDENSDSGVESTSCSWDKSVTEIKEHAYGKLEEELQRAREILKLRDEEVSRLRKMRQDGDNELLELTASLFEEAHGMVNEANVRRTTAEKALKESLMKVDVLSAEVTALKTLVLTLTPNKPPAFRLQTHSADSKSKDNLSSTSFGDRIFKKHHSSPSCFDLQAESEKNEFAEDVNAATVLDTESKYEMDPTFHREFMKWKEDPTLEKNNPFIERMYREDIDQCLDFSNSVLVAEMKEAIDSQNIFIEAVDKAKAVFPKKCALMEVPRLCHYRMKISDSDEWLYISQMCRNRIISVCNFLNYLRYIQRGLVKSSAEDTFWEVVRLRKEMMLAKLGLPLALLSR